MSVNLEVKGNLAKLLATENLIIENKQVPTASFDVNRRVLTLPMWQKASDSVYDMLVAHEVGHALYTPNEDPTVDVPHQFINVTEDARIEKLIKRKFAGLGKTFYKGYQELNEDDFFCLENENVPEMNLADRINLWFKIGNFINVPIKNGKEKDILNMVADAETFEDAQEAAKVLYEYCKGDSKKEEDIVPETPDLSGSTSGMSETTSDNQSEETTEESQESSVEESSGGSATSQMEEEVEQEEPDVKTDQALNDNIKNLVDSTATSNNYIHLPDVNLSSIVNPNAKVHNYIQTEFDNFVKDSEMVDPYQAFAFVDHQFKQFKKSAQKEVNYLVKEFECKKAADSYARSTTARTGVLDCSKLHTYKYNEDLFKKITTLHDGKNHGLIFILDWSGSMGEVLLDTLKQLYNLLWFCKKVGIPFKVYAFTYEFNVVEYDKEGKAIMLQPHFNKDEGFFYIDDRFSLMEFFTSDVSGKVLDTQMHNIWRVAYSLQHYQQYHCPPRVGLSGTPLNETLVALHKIIPLFRKQFKTQKVQCVVLTDGEASHLLKCKNIHRSSDHSYVGCIRINSYNDYYRNKKTGKTFKIPFEYHLFTGILLQDLNDVFPDVNFIGIRVLQGRDASYFMKRYCGFNLGPEYDALMASWRKQKSFSMKFTGYEKYFGISSSALSQSSEFDVADDATKSQIKSAFQKSLRTKKLNKKVLGEFIDLIV